MSHGLDFKWTPETIDALRKLHAEGKTYTEIANALGTSKNSVSGKIDRLKIPARGRNHMRRVNQQNALKRWGDGERPPPNRKPVNTLVRKRTERKAPMLLRVVIAPESNPVPLIERTGCCYPTTTEGPHLFCNLPTEAGPYCEFHQRVMYPKRRAA